MDRQDKEDESECSENRALRQAINMSRNPLRDKKSAIINVRKASTAIT